MFTSTENVVARRGSFETPTTELEKLRAENKYLIDALRQITRSMSPTESDAIAEHVLLIVTGTR